MKEKRRVSSAASRARLTELRCCCRFSRIMVKLYGVFVFRPIIRALASRLEGGEMLSMTLREILKEKHGVTVGKFSDGPCMHRGFLPR